MTGSRIRRCLLWVTSGVLSTIIAAIIHALTGNLAITLSVAAIVALTMGRMVDPIAAAAERHRDSSQR